MIDYSTTIFPIRKEEKEKKEKKMAVAPEKKLETVTSEKSMLIGLTQLVVQLVFGEFAGWDMFQRVRRERIYAFQSVG